jgi:cyclopropane fatty-acyl-phospholipid synthase-like methyltransferase
MPCNCCEITDNTFGEDSAKADVRSYRKRGPAEQTKLILQSIRSLNLREAELLDIGGGIGVLHHELLQDVADKAMHVDASSAYLKEAREEAARRGHSERVRFIHADFTDVASELPKADIVTLDRVVCCYPDFRRLLKAAADHSGHALAFTYPRETWYFRIGFKILNFLQRLRKDPFRVFLHPIPEMDSLLQREGFERVVLRRLFVWEMALYKRAV